MSKAGCHQESLVDAPVFLDPAIDGGCHGGISSDVLTVPVMSRPENPFSRTGEFVDELDRQDATAVVRAAGLPADDPASTPLE